jgi:hypothetical protein
VSQTHYLCRSIIDHVLEIVTQAVRERATWLQHPLQVIRSLLSVTRHRPPAREAFLNIVGAGDASGDSSFLHSSVSDTGHMSPMNQADPVVSRRTLDQVERKERERGESERGRDRVRELNVTTT